MIMNQTEIDKYIIFLFLCFSVYYSFIIMYYHGYYPFDNQQVVMRAVASWLTAVTVISAAEAAMSAV